MKSIEKKYKLITNSNLKFKSLNAMTIQPKEIEIIRKWRNEQMAILRQRKIISKQDQIDYYKKVIWSQLDKDYPEIILLSIFQNEKFVAYGGLVNISWENKRAEVSFVSETNIASNEKHYHNLFSQYLSLIKYFGFSELGLNRLFTETFDIRPKHILTLEKSGFILEGIMKSHVIINGINTNSLIHGILKEDYIKKSLD